MAAGGGAACPQDRALVVQTLRPGGLQGWQGTRALSGWFQGKGVRRPWGPGGPGSKPRSLRLWPRAPCVAPEPA